MRRQQWIKHGRSSRKSLHGIWRKSRAIRRLFSKHKETKRKSTFCYIDGTHVISQMRSWNQNYRSIKAEPFSVVTIVKDDSGAYAVLTEQDSSASKMTAAIVMAVIAKLPDCDGQAADAVSAYTQVKMEHAPRLLRIPKSECPDIRIRLLRHNGPNHGQTSKTRRVPLNGIQLDGKLEP